MNYSAQFLGPTEASQRLGVSAKALRLYEQRGLIVPVRTEAGWRTYGPVEMERASEIVALRSLGLSLTQVEKVLDGDADCLERALAAHEMALQENLCELAGTIKRIRCLRDKLINGQMPSVSELTQMARAGDRISVDFELPLPWGGEKFELSNIQPLTYITGPLGSGKTRLALKISENLPDAEFLGLDRLDTDFPAMCGRIHSELKPELTLRVNQAMSWLVEEGANASSALSALLIALEAFSAKVLVVDMIEQELDQETQVALIAYLRRRASSARPLIMLTRSNALLDMATVGLSETIIYCPANHSPPIKVTPCPGACGYEAVATCLAPPHVRARTEGVVAMRPPLNPSDQMSRISVSSILMSNPSRPT